MTDLEINQALDDLNWVRKARARYAAAGAQVDRLKRDEALLSQDSEANMVERLVLEQEMQRLLPVINNERAFLLSALERLRNLNGVFTQNVVTRKIGDIVIKRVGEGYSYSQVAMMVGCSAGTVSNIKAGRYRYSELPENVKVGGRRT